MEKKKETPAGKAKTTRAKAGKKPKKKAASGRKCSICLHVKAKEINSQIALGKGFRAISRQIQSNDALRDSLRRHTENCLKIDIRAVVDEKRTKQVVDHYFELREQLQFAKDLQASCKQILTDTDTGKVSLDPTSREITVLYLDHDKVNPLTMTPLQRSAKLQTLLDEIQDHTNKEPVGFTVKTTDIREYAFSTIKAIDALLDKFARVDNHYFKDKDAIDDEVRVLKGKITERAEAKGIPFKDELKLYLEKYGENLKPPIRLELDSELIH